MQSKKTNEIYILFIFISAYASSQSFSGKIRSVDGDNISFANIHIEGTNIGFSSDNQGSFYFSNLENRNYVFVVSCLGYETSRKEFLINGITKSDIILVESSNFTDEIVVT
ncbi:MAG: carboxypeptidase-like regulatory domain-containing protein [Flavobacteriales bacterium]|nr:carboxypeptidase-like regulatory domain-containing protein [Flavobacteriales bacterium]